jgi:F-type H+-transporting ATPase subunit delta
MPASVEKIYADALFSLITEENGAKSKAHTDVLDELSALDAAFSALPDYIKMLGVPTIAAEDKVRSLSAVFGGKTTRYTYNLLRLMAEKNRMGYFSRMYRQYRLLYNEAFGIAEVTVATPFAMDETTKRKLKLKLEQITGKTVALRERIDAGIIGGIVVDYGSTRYDGSVRTKLEALRQSVANVII